MGGDATPDLGELIRRFRDRAMLSQEALAERSGLSPRTVRALEIGQVRRPHAASLRLLSLALDLGPDDKEALVRSARRPRVEPPAPVPARSTDDAEPPQRLLPVDAPAELPPCPSDFTGRDRELARLDEVLGARPDEGPGTRIALVVGPAGVGKTALALRWAHRVRDDFPDGQLHVNLRGFAPGRPLSPLDALARMLRSLGIAPDRVPADVEEASGLFRTLLAGKRVLLLLDNAHDAGQVRPLLPADPACCAVLTSRDRMAGLVASHSATRVAVHVLGARESIELLADVVGDERVSAEPEVAHRLARACGRLPLALRVAAANLDSRPDQTLSDYVLALHHGGRLTGLGVDVDPQVGVRAAVDLSYVRLDEPLRRLFRLLSLAPGADITAHAGATLVGEPVPSVVRQLDQLVAAHLLQVGASGRYGYHDLLREYAQEQAARTDSEDERAAASERLGEWCSRTAYAAGDVLYGDVVRLPHSPPSHGDDPAPLVFDGPGPAAAWLDAECANLLATIHHCAGADRPHVRRLSWQLADALRGWFRIRPQGVEWLAATTAALDATDAAEDRQARAAVLLGMGDCHTLLGNHALASEHLARAVALARDTGWSEGFSSAMSTLAGVTSHRGRPAEALGYFEQALAAEQRSGATAACATTLGNLAHVHWELGHLDQAASAYLRSIELDRNQQARQTQQSSEARQSPGPGPGPGRQTPEPAGLAEVLHARGDTALALGRATAALRLAREQGDQIAEADLLRALAHMRCTTGDHAAALDDAQAALLLAEGTGLARLEADALNALGTVHVRQGAASDAAARHEQAVDLSRTGHLRYPETVGLIGLARAHQQLGDLDRASHHARAALTLATETGYRLLAGQALIALADVRLHQRRPDHAAALARRAAALTSETGHRRGHACALDVLSTALRRRGNHMAALLHRHAADRIHIALA
jgi:tetratricopeptide (TPR) repeat protein/transcriptional regulator with XRE-family HTH domain